MFSNNDYDTHVYRLIWRTEPRKPAHVCDVREINSYCPNTRAALRVVSPPCFLPFRCRRRTVPSHYSAVRLKQLSLAYVPFARMRFRRCMTGRLSREDLEVKACEVSWFVVRLGELMFELLILSVGFSTLVAQETRHQGRGQ